LPTFDYILEHNQFFIGLNKTTMNTELDKDSTTVETITLKQYRSPNLTDYGKMSELTQAGTAPLTVGDDGTYPSFTALS
jgi:hypothetical protein